MYGHAYEIATFRSDNTYVDGRHPSSVSFSGPKQDALRRDFTINGLFYDPVAGRLIDYVHGRNDIRRRLIRTIGDPIDRFAEDKLRMLRAVRLACCLGFTIVPESWDAIRKCAPEILQVSWERIRDELYRLLTGPDPAAGLDLLRESGLLKHILPEVEALVGVPNTAGAADVDVFNHSRTAVSLLRKPSAVLAFATLLHDAGKPATYSTEEDRCFEGHASLGAKICAQVCRRLKMSNQETDQAADMVLTHLELRNIHEMRVSAIRRFLRKPNIADRLELYRANCLSSRKDLKIYRLWLQKLEQYRHEPAPAPLMTGDDLIEIGYQPGPVFKDILQTVEDLQLDGALRTREEALEHVRIHFPPAGKARP